MRNRHKQNVIIIIAIIIAMLVFAWWASGEIYNPRPTKTPTVVIPTRVTAVWTTATPAATKIPSSTNTPIVPTFTPVLTSTATLAPTATNTAILYTIVEDKKPDCEMVVFKHNRAIYYYRCVHIGYRAKPTIGFTPSPIFIPWGLR